MLQRWSYLNQYNLLRTGRNLNVHYQFVGTESLIILNTFFIVIPLLLVGQPVNLNIKTGVGGSTSIY